MLDPFDSPKALLARSLRHLDEYRTAHDAYVESNPYKSVSKRNYETGKVTYSIRVNADYPLELGCIAFDVINGLRSAMDHAVFAASKVLTGSSFEPKTVQFPIRRTEDRVRHELTHKTGKARNVPVELHDTILTLEPFESDGNILWNFNEIRNENIHRMISPVAASANGIDIGGNGNAGIIHSGESVYRWNADKSEMRYAVAWNTDPGIKIDATVEMCFVEASALPFHPVLGTLNEIANVTSSIISVLERETARLLSLRPA